MFRRLLCAGCLAFACTSDLAFAQSAPAGEPKVSFAGYLQPQYESSSRAGDTTDRALMRRMVVWVEAALPNAWAAEIQVDLGPVASRSDGRLIVKDAYLQYTGWTDHGVLVTLGNQKMPFSRSLLASSSRRGLIERPLTGDRSLGSPGRALGLKAEGWHRHRTLYWSSAIASSRQSPDPGEIRLDGIAEAGDGWNEGPLAVGRVEFHPRGEVPRAQGDFSRSPLRYTLAAGWYRWWNDDDVRPHEGSSVDASQVTGIELSAGLRGAGVSVDAEFEHIESHAVDRLVSLGLYSAGRATIDKTSIEAGYMLFPRRLEALAGFEVADTAVFEEPLRRASAGMNWYVSEHRVKFSLMHRETFNVEGLAGHRSRATYVQAQFSF